MQFIQVSMSNHKSTELAIKNMEVQVGHLAKQLAERPTRSFMANIEKNSKEECKAIITQSQKKKNVEEEKRVESVLEDVSDKEGEDRKREEGEKMKKMKNNERKENDDEVLIPKTKILLAQEARREIPPTLVKEASYPLVPSKKDKKRHFKRFLDIFKKLEIIIPFGEVLQQMPLYTKFLKDLLTNKRKYINNKSIVVEGNCSAVI